MVYKLKVCNDENEGTALGQWKNDYVNCKFRAKSKGSYEFIENNIYYPRVKGQSSFDYIKPRDQWVWGDIYNEEARFTKEYIWTDKDGFVPIDVEE